MSEFKAMIGWIICLFEESRLRGVYSKRRDNGDLVMLGEVSVRESTAVIGQLKIEIGNIEKAV